MTAPFTRPPLTSAGIDALIRAGGHGATPQDVLALARGYKGVLYLLEQCRETARQAARDEAAEAEAHAPDDE